VGAAPEANAANAPDDPRVFRTVLRRQGDDGVHTYRIPGLASGSTVSSRRLRTRKLRVMNSPRRFRTMRRLGFGVKHSSSALRPESAWNSSSTSQKFRCALVAACLLITVAAAGARERAGRLARVPHGAAPGRECDTCERHRRPAATTAKGTLIAVFDIRHKSSADLPADIDVGVMRSTDDGATWSVKRRVMDYDAREPGSRGNGVGAPAILVDTNTAAVFVAALWSKGARAWNGSGPGLTPEETGQFVLTRSTDDGVTWSKPVSITPQVKQRDWRLCFNGPGNGIQLRDGTLVFPAQFKGSNNVPHSCFIASRDHGATWNLSPAAIPATPPTSESAIAELADGSLLLSMRDEWLRHGLDREHGGLLYFTDLRGLPAQEYWHDMKFWWPHCEAIIATLLAWQLTGDAKYARWHALVHDWSFAHFPDREHGEWFGYLHRDGSVSQRAKGNLFKGPFHLPRMLWYCWRLLAEARMKADSTQ
jgi:hypothetical protein